MKTPMLFRVLALLVLASALPHIAAAQGQIYPNSQCVAYGGWDSVADLPANRPPLTYVCADAWTQDLGFVVSNGTSWAQPGGGGTVNSIALTAPSIFSVSGSPVTSSGTLGLSFASGQTANRFLATPNGSSGAVALRAIASADLPATIAANTTGNAATATSATSAGSASTASLASLATALAATPTQCTGGQVSTGIAASGNANCATPTATSPNISTPNARTLSFATAFQATDTTRAAIVSINLTSTATLSLSGGTTNTATVVFGSTNAVASGTGTPLNYSNSNTGTLTVGLNLSQIAATPITFALPKGWFFAVIQNSGTVTITSAFDQAIG